MVVARFGNLSHRFLADGLYPVGAALSVEHDVDRENRALARLRADTHRVAEQARQALHNRKSEPEAETALARGVAELMVFVEDCLEILLGNADAGIPNLDPQYRRRVGGNRIIPFRAWYISTRSKAGCGSSAQAGADRCRPKGRIGPHVGRSFCACAW